MREYTVIEKQRITKLAALAIVIFIAGMFTGIFLQDESLRQMYIGCLGR